MSRITRVTGVTISPSQFEFARRRLFEAGLAERTDIRLMDYRDVEGRFDRVASIEMFEAVGEEYWPAYFGKVREVLSPVGRAGLQIITIRDELFATYRRRADFIPDLTNMAGGMGIVRDRGGNDSYTSGPQTFVGTHYEATRIVEMLYHFHRDDRVIRRYAERRA